MSEFPRSVPNASSTAADRDPRLLSGITGRLVRPGDRDYDRLRLATFAVDKRPAAIARVAGTADIAAVIRYAREDRIELAVRSGGHSVAGHSATDGGLVIDLRDLKNIDLDVSGGTVWAGSGATTGELTTALQPHRLIVGFGDSGTVGLGGITLGGGVGYLSRKHGLSIDSLLAAEIVTASGHVLIADETHHPDLFWALRGGGGNFGVVSRLKFRLHPLREFTGGRLVLPATADTIAGFVAAAEAAPDELSTVANIMPAPPMDFLPVEAAGKPVIMAMIAFAGSASAAERALVPFRGLAKPLADFVRPGSFADMFSPADPDYHPTVASRTFFVDRIGAEQAQTIVDFLRRPADGLNVAQLRVLGGAIARVPNDATAYGHRRRRVMAVVAAFCNGERTKSDAQKWADDFAAALDQGGAYVNFVGEEGIERPQVAYPTSTWDRLRRVKRAYDPENLFRLNYNIPPA
jgi:FAD/FMN-containing dehydrogenase